MAIVVNLEAIGANIPKTENGGVHGLTLGQKILTPKSTSIEVVAASHSVSSPDNPPVGSRQGETRARRDRDHQRSQLLFE
jgi:hypothetical protein